MQDLVQSLDREMKKKAEEWNEELLLEEIYLLKKADSSELNKAFAKHKKIVVFGGTLKENFFAANNKKVSVLLMPAKERHSMDLQTAKKCSENNTTVGFLFSEYLKLGKYQRAQAFRELKKTLKLCKKAKTSTAFFSWASNFFELRKKKDMESVCALLKA
jgi:RNase P/RNase MRP subunit p30